MSASVANLQKSPIDRWISDRPTPDRRTTAKHPVTKQYKLSSFVKRD
ncbi:hypothetical protein [Alkalinema sp. FACHB-956]|nr:hypothetical protein [Alkalinema sp. FACHB-956]MBD2325651.1 hypothetical protein [Alkalinema sp. FACHB-956]